jgi:type I protein arginine methyltransferase
MADVSGYSIAGYGQMVVDDMRMAAYSSALRQAIRPGSVILDIGAGTGILSMLACQYGAGRVYAVEPDDAIRVARQIAEANGFAERIEFIQDVSTRITLSEKADVIVSDLRGILPLFQQHIPSIIDARERLLAPKGQLIPQEDSLWAAIVEDASLYEQYRKPWQSRPFELDMRVGWQIVCNSWRKQRVKPENLLTSPQQWTTLDYGTISRADVTGEVTWTVGQAGSAHGLLVWFDTALLDGIGFSNGPDQPELIYGSAFFPLSEPVTLTPGDMITVSLAANLVGADYIWRWDTTVLEQGEPAKVKAQLKQSTFYGAPLSLERLRRQEASYVPSLSDDGRVDHFILSLMDGQTPLMDIARQVVRQYPDRFPRWQDALSRAAELAQRYSR